MRARCKGVNRISHWHPNTFDIKGGFNELIYIHFFGSCKFAPGVVSIVPLLLYFHRGCALSLNKDQETTCHE
jgi:hypothetical protein